MLYYQQADYILSYFIGLNISKGSFEDFHILDVDGNTVVNSTVPVADQINFSTSNEAEGAFLVALTHDTHVNVSYAIDNASLPTNMTVGTGAAPAMHLPCTCHEGYYGWQCR